MKPDTHTFWDPEKGKYVTIPLSSVIKPPTDDEQIVHKAVVAVDAVVSSAMSGIAKGFLWALAFVILFAIVTNFNTNRYNFENQMARDKAASSVWTVQERDAEIRRQNDIALYRIRKQKDGALAKLHTH